MSALRLDVAVQAKTPSLSRSFAQKLIKDNKVLVNGQIKNLPSLKVNDKDKVIVNYDKVVIPKIDLPILYEDSDCLVIAKPAGLLTHSKGAFNPEPTVATWLAQKLQKNTEIIQREGIVHRLDRGTSGVMICAKNPAALTWLQKEFSTRRTTKIYYALVEGVISPPSAVIDIPILRNPKKPQMFIPDNNGKKSLTTYETAKVFNKNNKAYSLLKLTPKTGRTHQIRVHLNYLKKPIVGDNFYGGLAAERLYLHAYSLDIKLPGGTKKTFISKIPLEFSSPRPQQ